MQPLKFKILNPLATFRMQPYRFIIDVIMRPLKKMIDQFVSKGVLVSNCCDFASLFVIVNKKDGELEWRSIIVRLAYT